IISNVKSDDMNNSDNNLNQFEKENVMQIIANIDNFSTNDQIIYNKAIIKSSIQAMYNNHVATFKTSYF
ncbi:5312_t:CDS:1, partial [Scutellospora calospora]